MRTMLALALLLLLASNTAKSESAPCAAEEKALQNAHDRFYDVMGKPDNPEWRLRGQAMGEAFGNRERCFQGLRHAADQAWPERLQSTAQTKK
jgi:hypothetical protein